MDGASAREKDRVGKLTVRSAVLSDVGRVRENNEDNFLLGDRLNAYSSDRCAFRLGARSALIAGVFDGMGGGEGGELASLHAAKSFREVSEALTPDVGREEIDLRLSEAFQRANNAIRQLPGGARVLGTTGTLVCVLRGAFRLFHLGDSRAYLFRGGALRQLTRDQTLAQMKIELGIYGADSETARMEGHQLTDYIGRDWTEQTLRPVRSEWTDAQEGDLLLLCSDGLYDCCPDGQIARILGRGGELGDIAERLIWAANQNGGVDNCTVALLQFGTEEEQDHAHTEV